VGAKTPGAVVLPVGSRFAQVISILLRIAVPIFLFSKEAQQRLREMIISRKRIAATGETSKPG